MHFLSSLAFAVLAVLWSYEDTTNLLLKIGFTALCVANIYGAFEAIFRRREVKDAP